MAVAEFIFHVFYFHDFDFTFERCRSGKTETKTTKKRACKGSMLKIERVNKNLVYILNIS